MSYGNAFTSWNVDAEAEEQIVEAYGEARIAETEAQIAEVDAEVQIAEAKARMSEAKTEA